MSVATPEISKNTPKMVKENLWPSKDRGRGRESKMQLIGESLVSQLPLPSLQER